MKLSKNLRLKHEPIGKYKRYHTCRFCGSIKLSPAINLGSVPLAGGFLKNRELFEKEKYYPLELFFCEQCFLLQSINVIDKKILFTDYFYRTSAITTLTDHFKKISTEITSSLNTPKEAFIVEIGCNDGTLIQELIKNGTKALGVDPASNIVQPLIKNGVPIINDYFSEKLAKKLINTYGKADFVCSFNVLAHIENMHDIAKGIKTILKEDGSLLFETHYLGNLLQEMQYDMIYHEHQYYYSLMTLQKFFAQYEMEIYDIKPIKIHAGSMRYYVQNKKGGKHVISQKVKTLLKKEKELKFHKLSTYTSYGEEIAKTKLKLLKLINSLKKDNKTIAGYGASGRGTTIMNYCGLDKNYLDYVIDDAPAKQGAYTPGTHLEIKKSDILKSKDKPDYIILFAWSFVDEIKQRNKGYLQNGGKFILPLPKVKIISVEK